MQNLAEVEVFIVYTKTKTRWQKILKDNFGHCFIIARDEYNWLKLDARKPLLISQILPFLAEEEDQLMTFLKNSYESCTIQKKRIKIDLDKSNHIPSLRFWTCVSFIKYALGIKRRFVLTPWQLYKYLNKE